MRSVISICVVMSLYVITDDTSDIIQPNKMNTSETSSSSGPTPTSTWLAQMVTSTTLPAG